MINRNTRLELRFPKSPPLSRSTSSNSKHVISSSELNATVTVRLLIWIAPARPRFTLNMHPTTRMTRTRLYTPSPWERALNRFWIRVSLEPKRNKVNKFVRTKMRHFFARFTYFRDFLKKKRETDQSTDGRTDQSTVLFHCLYSSLYFLFRLGDLLGGYRDAAIGCYC